MERRSSHGRPKRAAKRSKSTNIASTALGAEPEKRSLKKSKRADAPAKGNLEGVQRELAQNVKTAKGRKTSSTLWLRRQLNDPFVARAKAEGWRSRAAFKLIELDDKFRLLRRGARVVDLGAAPGGWSQVVAARAGRSAKIVGIDYLDMPAIAGVELLKMDFLDQEAPHQLKAKIGGEADLVLSDMAAPTTGHRETDHLRVVALAEAALDFAEDVLARDGAFVCKVFAGGAEGDLLTRLRSRFELVKHAKPKASRPESPEKYVVATGFRGVELGDQGE